MSLKSPSVSVWSSESPLRKGIERLLLGEDGEKRPRWDSILASSSFGRVIMMALVRERAQGINVTGLIGNSTSLYDAFLVPRASSVSTFTGRP